MGQNLRRTEYQSDDLITTNSREARSQNRIWNELPMKDIEIACNIIRAASRSTTSQTPEKRYIFSSHEVNIQNRTATASG